MPGFNIDDFKASLNNEGFLRTNHSQVVFSSPSLLSDQYPDVRDLLIRCEQSSLPAVWLTSDNIRRYGYGPLDKAPHLPQFDSFSLSFIADNRGFVHRYFYDWLTGIVQFNSSDSMLAKDEYGGLPYEMSYRNEYVTDMFVKVFNETTDDVLEYQMIQAWPQSIQEQPMHWQDQDNIVRVSVTFQYRDWNLRTDFQSSPIKLPPPLPQQDALGNFKLGDFLSGKQKVSDYRVGF